MTGHAPTGVCMLLGLLLLLPENVQWNQWVRLV